MKLSTILFALVFTSLVTFSQEITGDELLEKAIQFHDPNNHWATFNDTFFVTMTTPNRSTRKSKITINLPKEYFRLRAKRDSISNIYELDKNKCNTSTIGLEYKKELTKEKWKKKLDEDCKKAHLYKNYYTYLYGLPMKLKDDGTIIHQQVNLEKFNGEMYLTLKVTYKEDVGKDIWYFYFDSKTFALEAYQFYHDESKNDGEYILLTGLTNINGIKMPKERAWFYNKNAEYLGTDILSEKE